LEAAWQATVAAIGAREVLASPTQALATATRADTYCSEGGVPSPVQTAVAKSAQRAVPMSQMPAHHGACAHSARRSRS